MHIPTHILSGWCVGNLFRFSPRERLFCMLAASLQDLDGLGILISQELYWDFHHKLGHCLITGLGLSLLLTFFSTHRIKAFIVYLGLFHLHLVLDYFGSGPDWPLYYWWPMSNDELLNDHAWPFFSWQNILTAFALILWTLWIAATKQRTPLEVLMRSLDRKFVRWLTIRFPRFARKDASDPN
jgi:inner membrane protein